MKKYTLVVLCLFALLGVLISCATTDDLGIVGKLPRKWWEKSRGELQNYFRAESEGAVSEAVIFIGKSASPLNITETIALDQARLDAQIQLSRYLSQKVTGVMQAETYIDQIESYYSAGDLTDAEREELIKRVKYAFSNFASSVTATQFSSFIQEDSYTEEDKNGTYIGYTCYSMSDQVLEETRKLQEKAFQTLMGETEEYQEIMSRIQEIIAKELEESIMSGIQENL